MDNLAITTYVAGFAAALIFAIALSMCAFGLAEGIRHYVGFMWRMFPRSLVRWALMVGFAVPSLNCMIYFMGDLVGVDLRSGVVGEGIMPILISLFMVMCTWWLVVAAVGLTTSAVAAAEKRAKRDRDSQSTDDTV